jgi:hypothetical protein
VKLLSSFRSSPEGLFSSSWRKNTSSQILASISPSA